MSAASNKPLTAAMRWSLCVAARRPRRTMCPVITNRGRIHAAAEEAILSALARRALIDWNGPIPVINAAGLAVVDECYSKLRRAQ